MLQFVDKVRPNRLLGRLMSRSCDHGGHCHRQVLRVLGQVCNHGQRNGSAQKRYASKRIWQWPVDQQVRTVSLCLLVASGSTVSQLVSVYFYSIQ